MVEGEEDKVAEGKKEEEEVTVVEGKKGRGGGGKTRRWKRRRFHACPDRALRAGGRFDHSGRTE